MELLRFYWEFRAIVTYTQHYLIESAVQLGRDMHGQNTHEMTIPAMAIIVSAAILEECAETVTADR